MYPKEGGADAVRGLVDGSKRFQLPASSVSPAVAPIIKFARSNKTRRHQNNHQQQQQQPIPREHRAVMRFALPIGLTCLIVIVAALSSSSSFLGGGIQQVEAGVLMRVCDTREIKTVTNRVCMLYKRTKNPEAKPDKDGNIRVARGTGKNEYSPDKLASDCCKIGCPPHIFALNC